MTMSKPPALVETLKYTIADKGKGQGELRLEWEHHVATVPIYGQVGGALRASLQA